ncbi:MAG: methylmalonyl-CoA mutase family protein, partial [Sulfolobales archaeon]
PQSLITESAYRKQKSIEEMRKIVVGVNAFKGEILEEEKRIPLLKIDEEKVREQQIQRVRRVRSERDPAKWRSSLLELERAAMRGENIMPYVYNAAISRATLGEIMGTLREIYGEWSEPIYL